MNPHLPPDIDRMLWEVAESQDTRAFDDVEKRFPHLVGELGKRIQLVRELRDARGNGSGRPVPRFDRRMPSRIGPHPRAVFAFCAVVAACLGFGAFAVTSRLMNPPKLTLVPKVNLEPVPTPQIQYVQTPKKDDTPTKSQPTVDPNPVAPPVQVTPWNVPQGHVSTERAKLQLAILMVAASGKLDVEFAPNMPNPEIRMEYRNMSAINIIKDLGPRFHFTLFTEGGNRVLIVPEVDKNALQLPAATGSGYAATIESDPGTNELEPHRPRKMPNETKGPS